MTLWRHSNENIVEKGENAGSHHFLLFQQYFQKFYRQIQSYSTTDYVVYKTYSAFNTNKSKSLFYD